MDAYVIVATKGRPAETRRLLDCLGMQTLPPRFSVIVGSEAVDVVGLADHPWIAGGHGATVISPHVGLAAQRNCGLAFLERRASEGDHFCAFFDDDFRPAPDWLERAAARLSRGDIVGLTGHVLADGARTGGLSEAAAAAYLTGAKPAETHWASGPAERDIGSVYGCNMAFVARVVRELRFDEALPLYGWQEDRDYTGGARRLGRVIYFPGCRGVHLGANSGGRASGVRLGYSQIVNPLYLMRKGTMGYRVGLKFIARALAANSWRSIGDHPHVDYRGRLRGNLHALADIMRLRLDPRRVLQL